MRINSANDSANNSTSTAPWMHGGYSEHSNLGLKRDGGFLVVDLSIKYKPESNGEIAAFAKYKNQLSAGIRSGELLKDLVAKLQGTSWGDVPNPQGMLVQVLLPEGVTPPNQEVLENVLGMPSWVKGAIEFKNEPFKQPSAAQKVLFEKLSPPKSPNNSVRAD
jgi:hypothetical protein